MFLYKNIKNKKKKRNKLVDFTSIYFICLMIFIMILSMRNKRSKQQIDKKDIILYEKSIYSRLSY